jgi:hypothetical protein
MARLGIAEMFVLMVLAVVFVPWFFIYKKAGYHPAMGCLMFLPLVNIVMLFIFAFMEWPIERELRNRRTPPIQGA